MESMPPFFHASPLMYITWLHITTRQELRHRLALNVITARDRIQVQGSHVRVPGIGRNLKREIEREICITSVTTSPRSTGIPLRSEGRCLPRYEESERDDERDDAAVSSGEKHARVTHEHEDTEVDVGCGAKGEIRQQRSCRGCIQMACCRTRHVPP